MADGDRAAVRVDARVLQIDVHQPETAEHLAGEGLVDLDDVHIGQLQPRALKGARNGIRRPHAHDARLDAGAGRREDAGNRLSTTSVPPLSIGDYQRCRPIVDSRGVASGDYAAFEQRLEPGELVQRRVAPRVLVTPG